jgi:signal transduction protein with GAF and PtsI domain
MLEFKVSYGQGDEDVVGQRIPLDSGIAGYVVMTGQPIAIADVQQDPRFNQDFAKSTGYVPKSILATPLEWQDRVIGVMEVLDKIEAPRFDLHDMEMLGLFAKQASIAIAQSQQYDYIADMLVEGISTWVGEKAPEDIKPILEQLLDREGQPDEIAELSQIAVALQELFQAGRAERKMALQVLEAVRQYLSERSNKFKY